MVLSVSTLFVVCSHRLLEIRVCENFDTCQLEVNEKWIITDLHHLTDETLVLRALVRSSPMSNSKR